jgi:hypothetical protein
MKFNSVYYRKSILAGRTVVGLEQNMGQEHKDVRIKRGSQSQTSGIKMSISKYVYEDGDYHAKNREVKGMEIKLDGV